MPAPCVWNDWLPEPLATQVRTEEPKRLAVLTDKLAQVWRESKASLSIRDAATATFPYIPLVRALLDAKAEPETHHMQLLAETLLDIVLSTESDIAAQARWGTLLQRVLKTNRRKLTLAVPWRPWYEMLRRRNIEPATHFEGAGVKEARRHALVTVIHRIRRFFPAGAAAEIWAEFRPALRDPSSFDAFEALGWLAMLLPTQAALSRDGDWGSWVEEWMPIWGSVVHSHYWQALWMGIFSRIIKHDVHGLVNWPKLVPELWSRFLWAFSVPVGTATSSPPYSAGAPGNYSALFVNDTGSRSAAVAKAAIYLIGRCPAGTPADDDSALTSFEFAATLLEQYYHPSNGGKWTAGLATFLRTCASHLGDRLVAEHYAAEGCITAASDDEAESDGDESDEEDGGGGEMDDASSTDEEIAGIPVENDAAMSLTARRHLTPETRRRIASVLLRLAAKGQSSKDSTMRRNASSVLALLANIIPDLVLPQVHRHFVTALGTVTAARQYGSAIQTLSLCVRPLLLAGLRLEDADGINTTATATSKEGGAVVIDAAERTAARQAAAQSIVDAMMATLPGIDANDPPKSLATFRLYCSVLSSVGELSEEPSSAPGALPLYTDSWAEELFSRVFAIVSNLDAPEQGSGEHGGGDALGEDDGDSFLLDGNSMFRPLMELLYVRLPPPLRIAAVRRTSAFLLDNVFSSVYGEAAILCNAIAWADPTTTSESLLTPLLRLLASDAASLGGSGSAGASGRLSRVQENSLKWRLGLLSSTAFHMGPALVPHGEALCSVLGALAAAPSQSVQEAASRALSSILIGVSGYYPQQQYAACPARLIATGVAAAAPTTAGGGGGGGMDIDNGNGGSASSVAIEAFIDKYGNGDNGEGLIWHIPSQPEVDLANKLMEQFLVAPAQQLLDLCSPAGGGAGASTGAQPQQPAASKELLRSLMLQMEGALSGARSSLPDFTGCQPPTTIGDDANYVGIVGSLGATVGTSDQRDIAARALTAAASTISSSDADSLALCLRVIDFCLSVGGAEYAEAGENAGAWASDERWTAEPAVSGLLLENLGNITVADFKSTTSTGVSSGSSSNNSNGYGPKWRRRRPRWITAEKVSLSLQWRASQASYRWYASATQPQAPLSALPQSYLDAVGVAVRLVVKGPAGAWESAAGVIERCMKRYTALTPSIFASLFCGLARLPQLMDFDHQRKATDMRPQLREAARAAAAAAAAAASAGGEAESEAEQAMIVGPAALFASMAMWRYVTRDVEALEALCLGLIAAAAHAGAKAQLTITLIFLTMVFRFIPPPVSGSEGKATVERICADALAAASGSASASSGAAEGAAVAATTSAAAPALPWRYIAAANSLPLLLIHEFTPLTAAALAQHYLSRLTDDGVLTRQVASAGLSTILRPLWHVPAPNNIPIAECSASPEAVEAARNAVHAALSTAEAAAAFAPALMNSLALSHPTLSANETEAARLLAISRDNAYIRTLTHSLMINADWPRTRIRVSAVSAGHFVPAHARLIQVLCLVAPETVIPALRAPIEAALAGPQDTDRPAVAAAAEALAGIISSCALWPSNISSSSNQAAAWKEWVAPCLAKGLASAPLDWAVDMWGGAALRFAVFELLQKKQYDAVTSVLETALAAPQQQLVSLAAGSGGETTAAAVAAAIAAPMDLGTPKATSAQGTSHTSSTGAIYKRLCYATFAIQELGNTTGGAAAPAPLRALVARCLDELPSLLNVHGELLRHSATAVAADVTMVLTESLAACGLPTDGSVSGNNGDEDGSGGVMETDVGLLGDAEDADAVVLVQTSLHRLRARAFALLDSVVANLEEATGVLHERARSTGNNNTNGHGNSAVGIAAGGGADLLPLPSAAGAGGAGAAAAAGVVTDAELLDAADAVMEADLDWERAEGEDPDADEETAQADAAAIDRMTIDSDSSGEDSRYQAALSTVAFSLELTVQLLASNSAATSPWIVKLLPSVLRLQELVPPELQFVARKALVAAKYQRLSGDDAMKVLSVLRTAMESELWSERAAALAFSQYFWFRHVLLLGPHGTEEVTAAVEKRLSDDKLEVRELAAVTLSGVIRGLSPDQASVARRRFLDRAMALLPGRRRRRGVEAAPAPAPLPARHGAALALKALVLSSPYDVPSWLPEVLMALVRLASEQPPVRTAVTTALAEFRRTHPEDEGGMAEVKEMLTSEQWEAIRDASSNPASYFV